MANRNIPEKVAVTDELTPLAVNLKRGEAIFKNASTTVDLGLTSDPEENDIANCYPFPAEAEFTDRSSQPIYAIAATGETADVWVWEIEP
jgi:hypothetical protein